MKLHDVADAIAHFNFEQVYRDMNANDPESYPEDLPVVLWMYIYAKLLESWIVSHQSK